MSDLIKVPLSEWERLTAIETTARLIAVREVPGLIKDGRRWQSVDGELFDDLREALGIDEER